MAKVEPQSHHCWQRQGAHVVNWTATVCGAFTAVAVDQGGNARVADRPGSVGVDVEIVGFVKDEGAAEVDAGEAVVFEEWLLHLCFGIQGFEAGIQM